MKADFINMTCARNGWGWLPLDSFKITALLVDPTKQLWCRPLQILVGFW